MSRRESPTVKTRASLVQGLQAGDEDRWQEFCRVYGPVIRGFALKAGLSETEADEVAQETTIAVARHIPEFRYDPKVCRFKSWLLNQTSWRVQDALKKRRRWDERVHGTPAGCGQSPALRGDDSTRTATVERVADANAQPLDAIWDEEWRGQLLQAALEIVRTKFSAQQFQIFDLNVLKEWPAREVAHSLGVGLASVYLAKHRVSAGLRKEMRRLEAQWDQAAKNS